MAAPSVAANVGATSSRATESVSIEWLCDDTDGNATTAVAPHANEAPPTVTAAATETCHGYKRPRFAL